MHGQHIVLDGENEVHDGEHPLFDFSCVARARDDDDLPFKIDGTHIALSATVSLRVGLETRCTNDVPFGLCHPPIFVCESDEHVVDKQRRPGLLRDHAHWNLVAFVGSYRSVLDEDALSIKVRLHVLEQRKERLRRHRLVDVAPIHPVGCNSIVHQKTVLRGPSCECPCLDGQRALIGQDTFATKEGLQNELGGRKVPVGPAHSFESYGVQTRVERGVSNVFHDVRGLIIASSRPKLHQTHHPRDGRCPQSVHGGLTESLS